MEKTILFQGDSVTDVGRFDEATQFLGTGYPSLIAQKFSEEHAPYHVINRATSGNRVLDLYDRWQEDCIDLHPDVLTILIGINDCWRRYDDLPQQGTELPEFCEKYDAIVAAAVKSNPKLKLILMEPFLLPHPDGNKTWRVTLDPMIHFTRELAAKYHARLIPLDGIMNAAAIRYSCPEICNDWDGVHPTPFGQTLIANTWLKEFTDMESGK